MVLLVWPPSQSRFGTARACAVHLGCPSLMAGSWLNSFVDLSVCLNTDGADSQTCWALAALPLIGLGARARFWGLALGFAQHRGQLQACETHCVIRHQWLVLDS